MTTYTVAVYNANCDEWEMDSTWSSRKEASENSEILNRVKILKTGDSDTSQLLAIAKLNIEYYTGKFNRYSQQESTAKGNRVKYENMLNEVKREFQALREKLEG